MAMTTRTKVLISAVTLLCLAIGMVIVYLTWQKILAMPFRATNDTLHQHGAPITLDSLIPAGTHIDDKITIGEVIRIRFNKPKRRFSRYIERISEIIPVKYRLLGTTILYFFWTFLFLVFFRIFTWVRYTVVLVISFLAGALVYFFMPDLVMGRSDDMFFLLLAIAFAVSGWWYSRRNEL